MPKLTLLRGLAVAFVLITAAMFAWQNPGVLGSRLTPAEVDRYLAQADHNLAIPPAEKAEMLTRLRAWAFVDDGKPVYMLNLMRFYPQVRGFPGGPPASMTPAQANAYYESKAVPMLLPMGGSAPFMGRPQGQNVLPYDARGDHWSRMLLIRYPNRRAFLQLITDPRYPAIMPYKLASLEIVLAPFTAETMMPDYTQATAALLLIIFLGVGWWRAERRKPD